MPHRRRPQHRHEHTLEETHHAGTRRRHRHPRREHEHLRLPSGRSGPAPGRHPLHGLGRRARGAVRHVPAPCHRRLLRAAAEPVLPQGTTRRPRCQPAARPGVRGEARADVDAQPQPDQHDDRRGHRGAAVVHRCRPGRAPRSHRRRRLLPERTAGIPRGRRVSGSHRRIGLGLWRPTGHRPARLRPSAHRQDQGRDVFRLRGPRRLRDTRRPRTDRLPDEAARHPRRHRVLPGFAPRLRLPVPARVRQGLVGAPLGAGVRSVPAQRVVTLSDVRGAPRQRV